MSIGANTIAHYWDQKLLCRLLHRGSIKRVTVMIPDDLHKHLKIFAVENDTTLNDLILAAVKAHIQSCDTDVNLDPNSA